MDPTKGLSFVLARDNDSGEQYQLNSITFTPINTIPEPSTPVLVTLALTVAGVARRRSFLGSA